MSRPVLRLIKFASLLLSIPIFLTAHSTWDFESYLNSLSITLSDFPQSYAEALTRATVNNEPPADFDYSIFHVDDHTGIDITDIDNATDEASNTTTNTIPPIIHFIWFNDLYTTDNNPIPHHGSHAPARCRLFNPSYTIHIWNSSAARSFLQTHYPAILPVYNAYPYPIQRVDLLKYFLLRHYGGVYMDLDVACRRPLDPLLQFSAWWPKARPLGVNNDLMAARRGHPVVEYATGRLGERAGWWWGSDWVTVFWSTGPRFMSDVLKEWYHMFPEERYRAGEDKSPDAGKCSNLLLKSLEEFEFDGRPAANDSINIVADPDAFFILPEQFYSQDPGYTFFGHSPGGTWYGDDAHFIMWVLDRPWIIVLVVGTPMALWASLAVRRRRAVVWKRTKV